MPTASSLKRPLNSLPWTTGPACYGRSGCEPEIPLRSLAMDLGAPGCRASGSQSDRRHAPAFLQGRNAVRMIRPVISALWFPSSSARGATKSTSENVWPVVRIDPQRRQGSAEAGLYPNGLATSGGLFWNNSPGLGSSALSMEGGTHSRNQAGSGNSHPLSWGKGPSSGSRGWRAPGSPIGTTSAIWVGGRYM